MCYGTTSQALPARAQVTVPPCRMDTVFCCRETMSRNPALGWMPRAVQLYAAMGRASSATSLSASRANSTVTSPRLPPILSKPCRAHQLLTIRWSAVLCDVMHHARGSIRRVREQMVDAPGVEPGSRTVACRFNEVTNAVYANASGLSSVS